MGLFNFLAKRKPKPVDTVFFWFSAQQLNAESEVDAIWRAGEPFVPQYITVNKERIQFTEISSTNNPIGRFTDYKLVATGVLPKGAKEETPWKLTKA